MNRRVPSWGSAAAGRSEGSVSQGKTREEALANTSETTAACLEVRAERGLPLAVETQEVGVTGYQPFQQWRIIAQSGPQPPQKFSPGKLVEWMRTRLTLAGEVHSCYEAGPLGQGLHRQLSELGVKNFVVRPVCLDEHYRGAKHDRRDARELALRLDRYVAGNPHTLATVRVPSPEEERTRIASGQRQQLQRGSPTPGRPRPQRGRRGRT